MSEPRFPKVPSRPPLYRPEKKAPLDWTTRGLVGLVLVLQIATLVFVALLFFKVQHRRAPTAVSAPSPSPTNPPQVTSSFAPSPSPTPLPSNTPPPALEWLSEPLNLAFTEPVNIPFQASGVAPEQLNFTLQPGDIAIPPDQVEILSYGEGGVEGTIHLSPVSYVGDFQIQSNIASALPLPVHIEPPDIQSALTISPDIRMGEEHIMIPGVTEIMVNLDGNWLWGALPDGWDISPNREHTIRITSSLTSTAPSLSLALMFPDVLSGGEQRGWESPSVSLPVVSIMPLSESASGPLYRYDIIGRPDFPPQDLTAMDIIIWQVKDCSSAMWVLGDIDANDKYYRVMALGWVKPLKPGAFDTSTGDVGIVLPRNNEGGKIAEIIANNQWYPDEKSTVSCYVNQGLFGATGLVLRQPTDESDMMQLVVFGLVPK